MSTDGYLSKDRSRINALQRARRARMVRVDYMPNRVAVAILQAKREQQRPGSVSATNSAILDAIVTDWARLTGIKYSEIQRPKTPGPSPEFSDAYARANDFGFCKPTHAPEPKQAHPEQSPPQAALRIPCGGRRRRDGLPCEALSVPGKRRCKWHGGMSRGPVTGHGNESSTGNLWKGRPACGLDGPDG